MKCEVNNIASYKDACPDVVFPGLLQKSLGTLDIYLPGIVEESLRVSYTPKL